MSIRVLFAIIATGALGHVSFAQDRVMTTSQQDQQTLAASYECVSALFDYDNLTAPLASSSVIQFTKVSIKGQSYIAVPKPESAKTNPLPSEGVAFYIRANGEISEGTSTVGFLSGAVQAIGRKLPKQEELANSSLNTVISNLTTYLQTRFKSNERLNLPETVKGCTQLTELVRNILRSPPPQVNTKRENLGIYRDVLSDLEKKLTQVASPMPIQLKPLPLPAEGAQ